MKFYILTEEYSFGREDSASFEILGAYKSEEQAIKAMKLQHEKNMKLRPWRLLAKKDDLYIEETNNSIYLLDNTDAEPYYLLKVESISLQE